MEGNMSKDFLKLTNDKFVNVSQVNCATFIGKKAEFYFSGSEKAIMFQFNTEAEAKLAKKKFVTSMRNGDS